MVRRGLIPSWPKNAEIGYKLIHARGRDCREATLPRGPQGAPLPSACGRILRWQAMLGRKVPWRITLKEGEPFAFAGLWERWDKSPDGVADRVVYGPSHRS